MRCCLPLVLAAVVAGCAATKEVPEVLLVGTGRYDAAFDAAVEASRTCGLTPSLRDRRRGVIETEQRLAGSILEPWRGGNDTVGQALENTIAFQRWRARLEFTPPESDAAPTSEVVSPPDLLGVGPAERDLTEYDGPLELRVRVYIERAYAPGVRRDTWSRANTTRALIDSPAVPGSSLPRRFWVPVSRDPAYERRMLAAVQEALASD